MKTLLTVRQQKQWLLTNGNTITHEWSTLWGGSSRILHGSTVIGVAYGCGYDRYGAALGTAIETLFPTELCTLAKRTYEVQRKSCKGLDLSYNAETSEAQVTDSCCSESAIKILNRIGFSLACTRETDLRHTGAQFYLLTPITSDDRGRF